MKFTLIDRAIAQFSPEAAVRRMHARVQADIAATLPPVGGGHTVSALDDRNAPPADTGLWGTRWFRTIGRSAAADTLPYLGAERARTRELARTSPIAAGAINTNCDRVVGTGLALSAQPARAILKWDLKRAAEWKRKVQTEFALWSDSPECDQAQTQNFYELQELVLRSMLESGDCFSLLPDGKKTATMPYRLRVQVIEADRVGNPAGMVDSQTVAGGVRMDDGGAPVAFHVYHRHPGSSAVDVSGSLYAGQWIERIGAQSGRRRILQHFRKRRPDQPRGVTYLAPIIESLKQISRYTEAEIMAAVVTSYLTVFVKTETGSAAPVFGMERRLNTEGGDTEVALGMGAVVPLKQGETIETVDPNRPNPNFGPFLEAVIMQMGIALSLPYELLVKRFNASYSASKAALLDAGVYFRNTRVWLARSFCQPIYETWMAEAVMTGRIEAPGFFTDPLMRWAYTRAAWPGDSMGSINPKDEVTAYTMAVDARLMTRERAEWELFGSDFSDTLDLKKEEQDRLREAELLPVPKAGAPAPQEGASGAAAPTPAPAPTEPAKEKTP